VRVDTAGALREALRSTDGLTLIQAVVPRDDVPDLLATLTRALGSH
jgi:indolepyruvate decarboxylase